MRRSVNAGVVMLMAILVAAAPPAIGAAAPFRPTDPGFVVAELPAGAARSRDGVARQLVVSRSSPEVAIQLAAAFLEEARSDSQPQLYGRAESVLAPWMERPEAPAELLTLQADILQQRHEFDRALGLLDRSIARDPRSARARLMRANVRIVTGDLEQARADCTWLLGSGEQWIGTVCLAQILGSTGQLDRARALLERLTAGNSGSPSTAILAWMLSVRADLAVRAGDLPEAQDGLQRALTLAPASDYVRIALADVLITSGRSLDAVRLLEAARPSAGVLLRLAIALERTHDSRLSSALGELRERLTVSSQRGERMHLREETGLALEFSTDPRAALALARDNFAMQRETADVRLLARAACAAGDHAALANLRAWIEHTHYQDVAVENLLKRGRSSSAAAST